MLLTPAAVDLKAATMTLRMTAVQPIRNKFS